MSEPKCQECKAPAYVGLSYETKQGRVKINLCQEHAQSWWSKWSTTVGETATFSEPLKEDEAA